MHIYTKFNLKNRTDKPVNINRAPRIRQSPKDFLFHFFTNDSRKSLGARYINKMKDFKQQIDKTTKRKWLYIVCQV